MLSNWASLNHFPFLFRPILLTAYCVDTLPSTCLQRDQAMSSIINFKPIYGVGTEDPVCYFLEIDDYCVMLDCGWNERLDPALLEPLKQYLVAIC